MAEDTPSELHLQTNFSTYTMSRRALATSSTSSGHSPTSVPTRAKGGLASRPVHSASRSYELRNEERHKVKVLDVLKGTDRKSEEEDGDNLSLKRSNSPGTPQLHGLIDTAASVSLTIDQLEKVRRQADHSSPSNRRPITGPRTVSVRKDIGKRPVWARTTSGGLWYQRKQASSSQDGSSTRSIRSVFTRSDHEDSARIEVSPLRPPVRLHVPVRPSLHNITIETPFNSQEKAVLKTVSEASGHRRISSFDARHIFSAPFILLKKALRSEVKDPSPTPINSPNTSILARDHKSAPRKDKTAVTLARVSSMLESQQTLSRTKSRLRAWTHKSVSTTSSSGSRNLTKGASPTDHALRRQSVVHQDATSSILDMQMGPTPQNSETDIATYQIKRTASAESEVFPKIDISIRGGTSYLPSEARRIHTPPLPEPGHSGRRRGFFFDYNAPVLGEPSTNSNSNTTPTSDQLPNEQEDLFTFTKATLPTRSASQRNQSPAKPSGRLFHSKTADWYNTQLADIDSKTDDINNKALAEIKVQSHKRHGCQAGLVELKQEAYKAQLDYDIPEHLPSSPLCPRNPKYWRVVRNKGSQFRGCWMHGHGEYPPGETWCEGKVMTVDGVRGFVRDQM